MRREGKEERKERKGKKTGGKNRWKGRKGR